MKYIFTILLIMFLFESVYSQKEAYNWYFGEYSGVTFNTPDGEPVGLFNGSMLSQEGCASISDANGKLLFYTNGETVWNKNHIPMLNGTGLAGSNHSTQSAIIIPKPGSTSSFYIFTTDTNVNGNGLRYSELDISQSNGLGAVVVKNQYLFNPATEKLVGVKNSNGKDWWIISHEWNSDVFRVYKVTTGGVFANPVFSVAGSIHTGNDLNRSGYLKASLNGTKLALALQSGRVELFDFNNSTGQIYNAVQLNSLVFNNSYGVEFSGDGTKLYVTKQEVPSAIFQFDLSDWTATGILNTQSLIAQNKDFGSFGAVQIGPNKKIYIARTGRKFLSCISSPDSSGKSCNYIDSAVYLNERISRLGLPNFNSNQVISVNIAFHSPICIGDTIILSANNIFDAIYKWTGPNGFESNVREIKSLAVDEVQTGYYKLEVNVSGIKYIDSVYILVNKSPQASLKIYGNSTLCEGDSVLIEVVSNDINLKYNWSNGETVKSIYAKAGNIYSVYVINEKGCKKFLDTTIGITRVSTSINWLGSLEFCRGDSVILYALPIIQGAQLRWSTGETGQSIVVKESKRITLTITTKEGCVKYDSVDVKVYDKLDVNFGQEINNKYCIGDTLILKSNYINPDFNYLWSNGDKTSDIKLTKSTKGWLYVSLKSGCGDTAYFDVKFSRKPNLEISESHNIPLCDGESAMITASTDMAGCSFKWSTGQTDSSITIFGTGRYYVTVTSDSGCVVDKSIDIEFLSKPKVNIEPDGPTRLCQGNTIWLNATSSESNMNYIWSTGDRADRILVNQSGLYTLIGINQNGCLDTATKLLEFYPNPSPDIIASGPLRLCKGNTLFLSTSEKYSNYKWSTGDTTEQIMINAAGLYQVTVTDSNGCTGMSQPVKVDISDVDISILNLSNIKFGNTCVGTKITRTFSIENNGVDAVLIDTIKLNSDNFRIMAQRTLPYILQSNGRLAIDVEFLATELGSFQDTILIKITSPCFSELRLIVNGTGTANVSVFPPDTSFPIGSHQCIPIYHNLKCGEDFANKLIYSAKVRLDASMFFPDSLQLPGIKSINRTGSELIIEIEGELDSLVTRTRELVRICGTVLYGDFEWIDILIDEVIWNSPLISSVAMPGELSIYSICYFNLAHIKRYNKSEMEVFTEEGKDLIVHIITEEVGSFIISIYDLNGVMVSTSESYRATNGRETIVQRIEMNNSSPGFYIISLNTPGQIIRKSIIFYK